MQIDSKYLFHSQSEYKHEWKTQQKPFMSKTRQNNYPFRSKNTHEHFYLTSNSIVSCLLRIIKSLESVNLYVNNTV